MPGLESIPLRIPDKWDPVWFKDFVREVLALADARNAQPGPGITIEGSPDQPAVISSSEAVGALSDQSYVLTEPSDPPEIVPNARVLTGEGGVIDVDDSGPGGNVTIKVRARGIRNRHLRDSAPFSVIGRAFETSGEVADIQATADDTVLRRVYDGEDTVLDFGELTVDMAPDGLWTYEKLQDVSGAGVVLGRASAGAGPMEELTLGTGLSLDGTTLNATGGGGGALVYVNTSIPAGNTVANTTDETAFHSSYTIPADTLKEGMIVRVRLFGTFSTTGTPTLRLRIKLGASTYIDTGAIMLPSSVTDMGFCIDAQLVVHSAGATGEIDAQGVAMLGLTTETAQAVTIPTTSTVTTDTTGSLALSATAEWGTADADNTVTLREMAVWLDGIVSPTPDSGGANVTPDTHPATPDPMDDEFEGASLDSKWAWRNQGTATATLSQGALVLSGPGGTTASLRILEQTAPTPPWKFRVKLLDAKYNNTNFALAGIALVNTSNGRVMTFHKIYANGHKLEVNRWTNVNTFSTSVVATDIYTNGQRAAHMPIYLEVESDGTNVVFRYSDSGVSGTFIDHRTEPLATFLGKVDTIGLVVNNDGAINAPTGVYDWFRRIA